MIASIVYVFYDEVRRAINPSIPKAQGRKTQDVLRYSYDTDLIWYIFNFLMSFMPIVLIGMQEKNCNNEELGPFFYIIVGLTINHWLCFIFLGRIFVLQPKPNQLTTLNVNDSESNQEKNQEINPTDLDYELVFTSKGWWFWIPCLIIEITAFVLNFYYSSEKMIYVNYIPIDFTVTSSMFIFYCFSYKDWVDAKEEERLRQEKLTNDITMLMFLGEDKNEAESNLEQVAKENMKKS